MNKTSNHLFFCAIGGSGMLPLALMMKARGHQISGSDRGFDQGRTPERFTFITQQGITLFPQDGSGITGDIDEVVVSTAVEKTVPDYSAALEKKIPVTHRAALLARLSNSAKTSLCFAGTSGKSTTTAMAGWILHCAGKNPSIVNGAVMKNFVAADVPFASSVVGDPDLFVAEVDESDGSIDNFAPTIAVLNNISVDHKSMDELRTLFTLFLDRAKKCVINLDNAETAALMASLPASKILAFSLNNPQATLYADKLRPRADGISFDLHHAGDDATYTIDLPVPGRHNVSNALAALGASLAAGVDLAKACEALASFKGTARRMDVIGQTDGITVIDDFAHNPDKIAATLSTLHDFKGRLLILFQPHGYGPLKLMKEAFIDCFAAHLAKDDVLFLCDPLYLGGTTDKSVTSTDITQPLADKGFEAFHMEKREDCAAELVKIAREGDRLLIMGARDDTLPELAKHILLQLKIRSNG